MKHLIEVKEGRSLPLMEYFDFDIYQVNDFEVDIIVHMRRLSFDESYLSMYDMIKIKQRAQVIAGQRYNFTVEVKEKERVSLKKKLLLPGCLSLFLFLVMSVVLLFSTVSPALVEKPKCTYQNSSIGLSKEVCKTEAPASRMPNPIEVLAVIGIPAFVGIVIFLLSNTWLYPEDGSGYELVRSVEYIK